MSASLRGALLNVSGTPVFTSGALVFAAATQGIPFNHLLLKTRWAYVPGSHGTETIREAVLGRPPQPGRCTGSRLKHTPNLSACWSQSFSLSTHLEPPEVLPSNVGHRMPSLHSPPASLRLTGISQKGVCAHMWSPSFCNCFLADTSKLPGSRCLQGLGAGGEGDNRG